MALGTFLSYVQQRSRLDFNMTNIILYHRLLVYAICMAFVCGCATQNGIEIIVAEHNQEVNRLRVFPYDANAQTFVKKPDPPHDLNYVDFFVVLQNKTLNSVYLYEEQYSLGYNLLELDIRDVAGHITKLTKKQGIWVKNLPSMLEIPAGSSLAYPVSLDEGIWNNIPAFDIGTEVFIRARISACFMKSNGKMAKDSPSPIESGWTRILMREKRLAMPDLSSVNLSSDGENKLNK